MTTNNVSGGTISYDADQAIRNLGPVLTDGMPNLNAADLDGAVTYTISAVNNQGQTSHADFTFSRQEGAFNDQWMDFSGEVWDTALVIRTAGSENFSFRGITLLNGSGQSEVRFQGFRDGQPVDGADLTLPLAVGNDGGNAIPVDGAPALQPASYQYPATTFTAADFGGAWQNVDEVRITNPNQDIDVFASEPQAAVALAFNDIVFGPAVFPTLNAPSVTGTTTQEDTQSFHGLVITPDAQDGSAVTHYKISGIMGGTLFKSDGTTAIAEGAFITAAEGSAGLKFQPFPNANINSGDTFRFDVQSASDAMGTGLSSPFQSYVTVTEVNDAPVAADDVLSSINADGSDLTVSFAGLLANDDKGSANESGQTLNIISVSNAIGGTVRIDGTNVVFTPDASFSGPASFDYTVEDNGTTDGAADPKTDTGSVSFTVNPAAPVPLAIGGIGPQTFLENDLNEGTLIAKDATVTAPGSTDFGSMSLKVGLSWINSDDTISVRENVSLGGKIGISGNDVTYDGVVIGTIGTTEFIDDGKGTDLIIDLNAAATAESVQALLRAVTYTNTLDADNGAASRNIQVSLVPDSDWGTPAAEADAGFGVTWQNDGPKYFEDDHRLGVATGNDFKVTSDDLLGYDPENVANGTVVFQVSDEIGGQVYVNGIQQDTFTQDDVNAGRVTFKYDGTTPAGMNPGFTVTPTDGDGVSGQAAVISLDLGAWTPTVNHAPTLSSNIPVEHPGTTEDATWPNEDPDMPGFKVQHLLDGGQAGDEDAGTSLGVAVTATTGKGTWQYSLDGISWVDFGSVSESHALLLGNDAMVRYVPNGIDGEKPDLTIRAWDGTSGTASATGGSNPQSYADTTVNGGNSAFSTETVRTMFSVTEVNDAPVAADDPLSEVQEDSAPRVIEFSDLLGNDSATEAGQTLTITSVGNAVGGTVQIVGTTVVFTPTPNHHGQASFEYTVSDNGTTNGSPDPRTDTATVSFVVRPAADAPSATGAVAAEDTQSTSGLVISRSSFDGMEVNFFKITGITGGTLYKNDGTTAINNGDFITVAEGEAGLKFTPAANQNGNVGFGFDVQASVGTDGSNLSQPVPVTITVTEVNDAPNTQPDTLAAVEQNVGTIDIPFSALVLNDNAGPAGEAQSQNLDVIDVSDATGGMVAIVDGKVQFSVDPNFVGTASFTYTVRDNGTTNGADDFKTATSTVSFTVNPATVNTAPTIEATGTNPSFTENGEVNLFAEGAIGNSNDEGQLITGLTLTVTNVADANQEFLKIFDTEIKLADGQTGSFGAWGGSYSVSMVGGTATVTLSDLELDGYRTDVLFGGMTYYNTSEAPSTQNRVVTFTQVTDGGSSNNTAVPNATSTITVTSVNDAPVLADRDLSMSVEEGAGAPVGQVGKTVAEFLGGYSDADGGNGGRGIAVTTLDTTSGTWWFSKDDGANWQPLSIATDFPSATLIAEEGGRLYFQPKPGFSGNVDTGLIFRAWDMTSGTDGGSAYIPVTGGSTAFSSETDSVSLFVGAVNDAPTVEGLFPMEGLADIGVAYLFSGVTVADPDGADTVLTATFTLDTVGAGTFTYLGGFVEGSDGSYSFTGTAAQIEAALQEVAFRPTENLVPTGQSATANFTLKVSDGVNVTTKTTKVVSISINDLPVANDDGPVAVGEGATVTATAAEGVLKNDTDADIGDTLEVTGVSFGGQQGSVGQAIEGLYGTLTLNSDGSYTYVANKAAAEALGAGQKVTEVFSYTMRDVQTMGPNLLPTTVATLSFEITGSNDAAVISGTSVGSVTEDGTLVASGMLSVSDVDAGEAGFQYQADVKGTYGTFSFNHLTGEWNYVLDNSSSLVQSLKVGETKEEAFKVKSADGTEHVVSVTIAGAYDVDVVDGVVVDRGTKDNGDGTTSQVVTIPVVTPGRTETDGAAQYADIPVVTVGGRNLLTLQVGVGVGVTVSGTSGTKPAGSSLADLIREIKAHTVAGSADQNLLTGGGSGFLGSLPTDKPLVVQTITPTGGSGVPGVPLVIKGSTEADKPLTALVIDGRGLHSGTTLQLDNVEFAAIVGAVNVTGGNGSQNVWGDGANQRIVLGADDDTIHGGGGNDYVGSLGGNDQLFGDAGNDTLSGGEGDDTLDGGTGIDVMYGGIGNDTYYVDMKSDRVVEHRNEGIDTVVSSISYTLHGSHVENLTLTGNATYGYGNSLANVMRASDTGSLLYGWGGNDTLVGGASRDRLYGSSGNDKLYGNGGNDRMYGGTGNDRLDGGAGRDYLVGGSGNDVLKGGDGNDTISAGSGNDVIYGGLGADLLIDSSGRDTFVFDTKLGNGNVDTIRYFNHGPDTIRLDDAIFTKAGPKGWLKADAFHVGAKAADAEDRIVYDAKKGALYYDKDGAGGAAQVQFAKVGKYIKIMADDFYIA